MTDPQPPIITLLTDFGLDDGTVGVMKGVILGLAPRARLVDLSHGIGPQDIRAAAFVLGRTAPYFPDGTIHLVVVDPGVGTARRPILVCTERHYFVAPDNGVLSFIYDREVVTRVVEIQAEHYRRETISPTFHGRDIFGPAAAWLTRGIDPTNFGDEITDYKKIEVPKGKPAGDRALQGMILHVDRFGNLVTSIHQSEIEAMRATVGPSPLRIQVGERVIGEMRETYMEGGKEEVFGVIGSTGYLEIAASRKGAAGILNVRRTERVQVSF